MKNTFLALSAVLISLPALAGNASVTVSTVDELAAALAAVTNGGPKEVVLRPGEYVLKRTLSVGGPAADGLVLRAEKPGTAVLSGGIPLTGWTRDAASGLWSASVPEGAPCGGRFRLLVKNGAWAELAVYPGGTNRFEHGGSFGAFLLPNLAGHWSRKPTDAENRIMPYSAKDLPDTMDLENADVHLFHMWGVSLCTVEKIDRANRVLTVAETPEWPMGACERRQYEIWNVREGLRPGGWYLDRKRGRVWYKALPDEDPNRQRFVLPVLERLLTGEKIRNATVDGLVFTATSADFSRRGGFGGSGLPAAFTLRECENLKLRNVKVTNVGGVGIDVGGARGLDMCDCEVSFSGALSLAATPARDSRISRCLLSDAGKTCQASAGAWLSGEDVAFCGNEIRRTPYSGVIGFGSRLRFETNFVHHVMQVLHDGAAFYGLHVDCVMRGNVVRDVRAVGKGFGVHAYYSDEGSRNTLIADNYAEGMPVPVHCHMTVGMKVTGNALVNRSGDLVVSFERSRDGTFAGNRILCDGELKVVWPDAVPTWRNNAALAASKTDALSVPRLWSPERPLLEPRGPLATPRAKAKPTIDGAFADGEWEGDFCHLERSPERRLSGFADALARCMWDDECLYVSVIAANFPDGKLNLGSTWGRDDGIELDLGGGRVVRGFNDGSTFISPALGSGVRIVAAGRGKSGHSNPNFARYEIAVPWKSLGVTPKSGLAVPFGLTAYVSDAKQYKCYDAPSLKPVLLLTSPRADACRLRLGVASDVHISCKEDELWKWKKVLEYFRDQQVDAVVVPGDLTNRGLISELRDFARTWWEVFPDGKRPDGAPVEKVFVAGNHDPWICDILLEKHKLRNADGTPKKVAKGELDFDLEAAKKEAFMFHREELWPELFHEPYSHLFAKQVKGYWFIGSHWRSSWPKHEYEAVELPAYLKEHAAELGKAKPFFFVQHCHPNGTCHGVDAWWPDCGKNTTEVLKDFPNAVCFSGHSHVTLTDPKAVWQGAFTSIGAGSLSYCDGLSKMSGQADPPPDHPWKTANGYCHSAYVVDVYDDHLAVRPFEVRYLEPTAEEMIVPVPVGSDPDFAFAKRSAGKCPPGYDRPPKVVIRDATCYDWQNKPYPMQEVAFAAVPQGDGSHSRVYAYEITMKPKDGSPAKVHTIVTAAANMAPRMEPDTVLWHVKPGTFKSADDYDFTIVPIDAFRNRPKEVGK